VGSARMQFLWSTENVSHKPVEIHILAENFATVSIYTKITLASAVLMINKRFLFQNLK
jgi:hypothetical protein